MSELEAAWAVAALRHGEPKRRDRAGAPSGTHDFDIHLPEHRVAALEVTSSTVPEVVQMWAAIDKLDWAFDGNRSWSVSLEAARKGFAGTRVASFNAEGPKWFQVLGDEVGLRTCDVIGDTSVKEGYSPAGKQAVAELNALGVRNASPIDTLPGGRPYIVVGTVGLGGSTDGQTINEAVKEAGRANLDKLMRARADESHLWMWVDQTDNESYVAMCTFSVPNEGPDLPEGIDTVWAGVWMQNFTPWTNIYVLWRAQRGRPWEKVVVPDVRRYAEAVTRATSHM